MIKNILIKVSGDIASSPTKSKNFLDFAKQKAKKNYVVVICGAGTKIGKALNKRGYKTKFSEHGRITKTLKERKIARDVLEESQKKLQDKLIGTGVSVVASVIEVGSVICQINGDSYVKAAYLGFDEIYVFTLEKRIASKKQFFEGYPKVKIRAC